MSFLLCKICEKELGPLELQAALPFHFDCRKCTFCQQEIPNTELCEKSLLEFGEILHSQCAERKLWSEFQKTDVPLGQSHINLINKKICGLREALDLSNLEIFYSLLRDLQQCAANVKVLIDRTKDRQKVEIAKEYREKVTEQKKTERERTRIEEERRIMLQSERDNPALRDRRKAIEGLMKLGIAREAAEKMVPTQLFFVSAQEKLN